MRILREKNGITLIALVITIIVLLIFAGVSIATLTGENGLITKTGQAKLENKRANIKEAIDLTIAEEKLYNYNKSAREILEAVQVNLKNTEKNQIYKLADNIDIKDTIYETSTETYFYVIADGDIYKVQESGTTFEGEQEEKPIEADIKFNCTSSDWTKDKVTVEIINNTDKIKNPKIMYSIDDGTTWTEYTKEIEISKNLDIHAKVEGINGISKIATQTISNIDVLPPNNFTPTIGNITENSIEVTASTTDQDKTIEYGKSGIYGYSFSNDDGKTWSDYQVQENYTFTGLTKNTSYTIKVKAKDNAGNEIETEGVSTKTIEITLTLSSTSGRVVSGNTVNVTVSGSNYGTLSCSSSNTSIATASLSGNTLAVTGKNTSGTQNATITVTGSKGGSATYTITSHVHSGSSSSGGGCYGTANTGYTNCGGSVTAKSSTTTCGNYNLYSTVYKCSGCGSYCNSSGTHMKIGGSWSLINTSSTAFGYATACGCGSAKYYATQIDTWQCSGCGATKTASYPVGTCSACSARNQSSSRTSNSGSHYCSTCGTYQLYARTYKCSSCGTTSSSSGTHYKSSTYYTCNTCGTSYSSTGTCTKSTSYTYYTRNCGF